MTITPKEDSALNLIKESKDYEDYFFKKVTDIKWFIILKERNYFSSQNAPSPIKADKEGFYNVPYWNVLDYLERVSQEVNKPENIKYINDLIEIIKDVTQNGPKDNFRIWWYFVKIISNLPNEHITDEIIQFIPIWLDSQFGTSLQGKEITDRLLPKFLNSDKPEDIEKVESIIKFITELRKIPEEKNKTGTIIQEEKYLPMLDGYWLSEAFDKNAEKIAHKCSNLIFCDLQKKIEKLLEKESYENSIEYQDCTLIFSLKPNGNNYLIERYEFEKNLNREDLYLIFNKLRNGVYDDKIKTARKSPIDVNNINSLTEFLNNSPDRIISIYPKFKERKVELQYFLKYLYLGLFDAETYESLYDKDALHIHKTFGIFHSILESIISKRVDKFPEETKKVLHSFLHGKYLYLVKFAFYIIGIYYDKLNELFLDYIEQDTNNIFLDTTYFGDEIRKILKSVNQESTELTSLLKEKIEKKADTLSSIGESKESVKKWKQRYYKALSHINYFEKIYRKLKDETGIDPELGPAIQMGESRFGPGSSPLSNEELFKMSNEELADFLKKFKTKHPWNGPTEGGLAEQLRQIAKSKPSKFVDNMMPFINTAYYYIYDIFWGLVDAWDKNEPFNWGSLLDFVYEYINRDNFWNKKLGIKGDLNADFLWVTGVVGKLIQVGAKSDEHAFAQELNEKALDVIDIILKNLKIKVEKEFSDPVTDALNSPYGKTLTALIFLSLKDARYFDRFPESGRQRWNSRAKKFYEIAFDKKIKEAYTLFGQSLSNFHYLDGEWTEKKIEDLKNYFEKDTLWDLFIEGYLFGSKVYNDIYTLMAPHYEFALSIESKEDRPVRQLVKHIAIGYLQDINDKLDKPLYGILIDEWNPLHIYEMIGFFWMQRDYLIKVDSDDDTKSQESEKQYVNRILKFWETIYERYKNIGIDDLTSEDKKILASSGKLAVFLNTIDETNFKWLKLSASYIEIEFNSPFFIEYLNILKDKGENKATVAHYVSDIFLEMLKSFIPDYDKKNIFSIVEYLFKTSKIEKDINLKGKANQICNIYGPSEIRDDNGREFLRDLYERYNSDA